MDLQKAKQLAEKELAKLATEVSEVRIQPACNGDSVCMANYGLPKSVYLLYICYL